MRVVLCLLCFAAIGFSQLQDPTAQQQADVGPTILSRTDMQVPAQVARDRGGNSFDYFLFADGFFSTGIQVYTPEGIGAYGNSAGFDGGGGIDLHHNFRRGSISLQYSGDWRQYSNATFYQGYRQGLNFVARYSLTRRLLLTARQNIASAPNGSGIYQFSQSGYAGTNGIAGESRIYVTSGTVTYSQSARLSYDVVGDFFASQYRPNDNYDSQGGSLTGSVNYRTSKKATISGSYSFSHFTYSQQSQDVSNNQTAYGTYAYEITPRTQFAVSGGVTSADVTQGIEVGTPPMLAIYHSTTTFPYFAGQIQHQARRFSASAEASQKVLAGNGFLGTSKDLSFGGTIGYAPSEKWALSFTAGYMYLSALGTVQTATNNSSAYGGVGFNYKLSRHFGLKSSFHYYSYDYYGSSGRQPTTTLSFGITYNSGDRPILFF